MVIDMHVHIGALGTHYEDNTSDLRRIIETYNVDRMYISAVDLDPIIISPESDLLDQLNAAAYKFSKEMPENIGTYVYNNPLLPDALDRLCRGVEEHGAEGMKLWSATFCDDPVVNPLIEKCIDYDIPVLVHCAHKGGFGSYKTETLSNNVRELAKRYPEANIIMAHLGGNAYLAARTVQDCPNVYTDISGSIYRGGELEYTVKVLGAERVMFGSDLPYVPYSVNLGQMLEAELTEEEKELIFYKNALRIFKGIKGGRSK